MDRTVVIGIFTALRKLAQQEKFADIADIGRTIHAGNQNIYAGYPNASNYAPLFYVLSRLADNKDLETIQAVLDAAWEELQNSKDTAMQNPWGYPAAPVLPAQS